MYSSTEYLPLTLPKCQASITSENSAACLSKSVTMETGRINRRFPISVSSRSVKLNGISLSTLIELARHRLELPPCDPHESVPSRRSLR